MFGVGIPEMTILAAIIILLGGLALARRGRGIRVSGPALVLKKFNVIRKDTGSLFVEIVGRPAGLTSWLLTVIGLEAETSLTVSGKDVSFRSASLFGQTNQVAPLSSISSTHCGYSKPIGYLILGVIFIFAGVFTGLSQRGGGVILISGLILGGVLLVAYFLSKKMTISLETSGGIIMGLVFKRSVIENVAIDIQKVVQTIRIVNENVIKSQRKYLLVRQK